MVNRKKERIFPFMATELDGLSTLNTDIPSTYKRETNLSIVIWFSSSPVLSNSDWVRILIVIMVSQNDDGRWQEYWKTKQKERQRVGLTARHRSLNKMLVERCLYLVSPWTLHRICFSGKLGISPKPLDDLKEQFSKILILNMDCFWF